MVWEAGKRGHKYYSSLFDLKGSSAALPKQKKKENKIKNAKVHSRIQCKADVCFTAWDEHVIRVWTWDTLLVMIVICLCCRINLEGWSGCVKMRYKVSVLFSLFLKILIVVVIIVTQKSQPLMYTFQCMQSDLLFRQGVVLTS